MPRQCEETDYVTRHSCYLKDASGQNCLRMIPLCCCTDALGSDSERFKCRCQVTLDSIHAETLEKVVSDATLHRNTVDRVHYLHTAWRFSQVAQSKKTSTNIGVVWRLTRPFRCQCLFFPNRHSNLDIYLVRAVRIASGIFFLFLTVSNAVV